MRPSDNYIILKELINNRLVRKFELSKKIKGRLSKKLNDLRDLGCIIENIGISGLIYLAHKPDNILLDHKHKKLKTLKRFKKKFYWCIKYDGSSLFRKIIKTQIRKGDYYGNTYNDSYTNSIVKYDFQTEISIGEYIKMFNIKLNIFDRIRLYFYNLFKRKGK